MSSCASVSSQQVCEVLTHIQNRLNEWASVKLTIINPSALPISESSTMGAEERHTRWLGGYNSARTACASVQASWTERSTHTINLVSSLSVCFHPVRERNKCAVIAELMSTSENTTEDVWTGQLLRFIETWPADALG